MLVVIHLICWMFRQCYQEKVNSWFFLHRVVPILDESEEAYGGCRLVSVNRRVREVFCSHICWPTRPQCRAMVVTGLRGS